MAKRIGGPIRLDVAQYAALAVTVLVVLPVIFWIVFGATIRGLYVEQVVAPRVKAQFGFEVGLVHLGPEESDEGACRP